MDSRPPCWLCSERQTLLASTVDPKRWSSLLGPRPQPANRLIEFSAIATPTDPSALATASSAPHITEPPGSPTTASLSTASRSAATPASYRTASAPSPAVALASESRRLIEAAVERVGIRDGSIEIALTREAAAIVGERPSSLPGRSRPRGSAVNSSRRSKTPIPTRERVPRGGVGVRKPSADRGRRRARRYPRRIDRDRAQTRGCGDRIIELLQRGDGATLAELVAATGWLPHTTRAALTGLRKRGYAVGIDRADKVRGSVYRIEPTEMEEDSAAPHAEASQTCEAPP